MKWSGFEAHSCHEIGPAKVRNCHRTPYAADIKMRGQALCLRSRRGQSGPRTGRPYPFHENAARNRAA